MSTNIDLPWGVLALQAEVDADDLQVLHAAHNLLEVIDLARKQQTPGVDFSPIKASVIFCLLTFPTAALRHYCLL